MNCTKVKQNLIFLVEGSLQPELSSAMHDHLAQCSNCNHVFEELRQTLAVIETEKQVQIDPWFAGRVEQQLINLKNESNNSIFELRPVYRLIRMIPVAASLILALFIGILIGSELNAQFARDDNSISGLYEELMTENIYEKSFETFFLTNGEH